MSRVSRYVYLLAAWVLFAGVLVQVYLAGMVYVAREMSSSNHMSLGHTLPLPILVMLLSAYLGRLPGAMKRLTWLLFIVFFVQVYVLMWLVRESAPSIAALHPVLALVVFGLSATLAVRAWRLVRQDAPAAALQGQGAPAATD